MADLKEQTDMVEDSAAKRGRLSWWCADCGGRKAGYRTIRCGACGKAERARKSEIRYTCPGCGGRRVRGAKFCRECANKAQRERLSARWADSTIEERRHHARGLIERNRVNPTRRKYSVDHHYFDAIDTPEKAYWLGFIAGDGGIDDGALVVGLAERDADHLQRLASSLGSDAPISHRDHVAYGKSYRAARLTVTSWRLVEGLAAHGIRPRKTLDLEPWNGPTDLMPHYWRGLVDADGTISCGPHWELSLVGTQSVVTAFGEWARGVEPLLASSARPHKTIWKFAVGGRHLSRTVACALYGGATVALPRKAERAAALIATGSRPAVSAFATVSVTSDGVRHGTNGYRHGCRCDICRAAHTAAANDYAVRRRSVRPPRLCQDCGADVSHRYHNVKYCEACSELRARARGR